MNKFPDYEAAMVYLDDIQSLMSYKRTVKLVEAALGDEPLYRCIGYQEQANEIVYVQAWPKDQDD